MQASEKELMELRRGIARLTDEARKNEDAWKRSLARQIKLLEADTLTMLLGHRSERR